MVAHRWAANLVRDVGPGKRGQARHDRRRLVAEAEKRVLKAIRQLDYAVIICDDVEPMRQFYESTLGFPLHRALGGSWIELRIGASILALRPRDRPYDGPVPAEESAGVQLAFRLAPGEVAGCQAELIEHGVAISSR
jgi:hypothetical protein